ncbi:MAG: hypothetical protein ABIR64_06290 [Candidatus Limnocylindrales bacterium]
MNVRMRRPAAAAMPLFVLFALVAQACSAGPSPAGSPVPTAPASGSGSVATAPAAPTPSPAPPADAAPAELQGRWKTLIAPNDPASLIIGETSYQITRGDSGGGRISVQGDTIVFSDSRLCVGGVGTYTWAIDDGVLTFTPVGRLDTCPRVDVLLSPFER